MSDRSDPDRLSRPGRSARIVLTGPGGGDWSFPMEVGAEVGVSDVTLMLPAVDWCRRFSERLGPDELDRSVQATVSWVPPSLPRLRCTRSCSHANCRLGRC